MEQTFLQDKLPMRRKSKPILCKIGRQEYRLLLPFYFHPRPQATITLKIKQISMNKLPYGKEKMLSQMRFSLPQGTIARNIDDGLVGGPATLLFV